MNTDLLARALTISSENTADLAWTFQTEGPRPERVNLDELAVEVDWGRKRNLWMLYGSCNPEMIDDVLGRITDCSNLVVLEAQTPDAYFLSDTDRQRLSAHIQSGRLNIVLGGSLDQRADAVLRLINIDILDSWKPIIDRQTLEDNPEVLRNLFARLASGLNIMVMGKSTLMRTSLPYLRNALLNAPLAMAEPELMGWRERCINKPMLIVAAGPSLNKQLDLLAQNQDLFTILAVDKVWPILKAQGIKPDVVLALDPHTRPSWPHNQVANETAFCVDLGCAPKVMWSNERNHVVTSCNPHITAILQEIGVRAELLGTGGSVATSAFELAVQLGGNPIVFIGQDLALTGGKDHAEGYPHAYSAQMLANRSDNGFDVEGYHGGRVRTERQLLFYKTWFENRIQGLGDRVVINATEGGAAMAGALQLPFAAVCAEIRRTSLRKASLISTRSTQIDVAHMKRLRDGLADMAERLRAFRDIASQGRKLCRESGPRPSKKRLARIDAVNQQIRDHEPRIKMFANILSMVQLDRIRYKAHFGDDMDGLADAIKKYDEIYQNIETAVELALKMIDRVDVFYVRVAEGGRIDPELLEAVF